MSDTTNQRERGVEEFPYVSVVLHTTGIHPSTARIVTIDAATFDDDGAVGERFHQVLNPGIDPGPAHMHGITPEQIEEADRFSHVLKPLDRLIDGRTLVVHNASQNWGFIVSEARRAMNAAARANRARNRNRNRNRRRQRVGHVPKPVEIVDTLATARRQAMKVVDTRINAVAQVYGIDAPSPVASQTRAHRDPRDVAAERVDLVTELFLKQTEDADAPIASLDPADMRADKFGLQRSELRVDALDVPRTQPNPGPYEPGRSLKKGMEVVVAPEIAMDPDEIIAAALEEELAYVEKLTRETSVVVCNDTTDLRGKAMHAHRKGIPLMSDVAFMAAIRRMKDNRR